MSLGATRNLQSPMRPLEALATGERDSRDTKGSSES